MISPNNLPKSERLSGKTTIAALMKDGKWGREAQLKYCVRENGLDFSRIMVSVPKKNFKRAVKRNLLKRRLREAYRTQKTVLSGHGLDIMLFYNSTEILSSAEIHSLVGQILGKLKGFQVPGA